MDSAEPESTTSSCSEVGEAGALMFICTEESLERNRDPLSIAQSVWVAVSHLHQQFKMSSKHEQNVQLYDKTYMLP